MKNYEYDVYVSFTGADRALKNDLHRRLRAAGLVTYDSDELCAGRFREDYMQALDSSRVFLLILSDHLLNDPAKSGTGTLSEVRKELAMAYELEMRNELNIVALCLSDFFYFKNGYHEYGDYGWTYYTHTRGFSLQDGVLNEDGTLDDGCYLAIEERIKRFIKQRNEGRPVTSYAPRCDLADEKIDEGGEPFIGRDEDFREVIDAFRSGTEAVVLHGMGGNGKTRLARRVAAYLEEEHLMRVAQIIHIQESRSSRDAMSAIVESARYSPSVLASLHRLNESEKYEKKLSALCEVPENTLLVIDNLNRFTEGELRGIVSKTKCKLLITTRANIPSTKLFLSKEIREIPERFAKDIFAAHAGFIPEDGAFSKIYEWAGGHTITLCILAKTAAMHRMSTEELLELISTPSGIDDARVEFKHNEYGESDTVIGHLSNLFGFGDFSEGAKDILRSMCILAVGEIPLCDLCRVLGLKNYNDVNELIKYGWLETRMATDPRDGTEKEYIYIHPVVMHLIAGKLPPRLDTVMPMVGYILEATDTEAGASYAGIPYLAGAVFHALLVISAADGRLPRELFDRFVKLDRLIGDEKNTAAEVDALLKVVTDEADRATLTSYRDMIILEQHPARISVYDRYLSELMAGADDYKWVIRSLSVTGQYLAGIEESLPALKLIIDKALTVAMNHCDDLAITVLMTSIFTFYNTSEAKVVMNRINSYIRMRRKSGDTDSDFYLLDYLSTVFALTDGGKIYSQKKDTFNSIANGDNSLTYKMMLRHPLTFLRNMRILTEAQLLPEGDPIGEYFRALYRLSERLTEEGRMDLDALLEIAVSLHTALFKSGLTLLSCAQMIDAMFSSIQYSDVPKTMDSLIDMASSVDMNNITVGALSSLHIAVIISKTLGNNKDELGRCERFYKATKKVRPSGHPDVIYAAKKYADSLIGAGMHSKALVIYFELYNLLSAKGENSTELATVATVLLDLFVTLGEKMPDVEMLEKVFLAASCNKKVVDYKYQQVLFSLTQYVILRFRAAPIYQKVKGLIADALNQIQGMGANAQSQLISTIDYMGSTSVVLDDIETVDICLKQLAQFKKSKYKTAKKHSLFTQIIIETRKKIRFGSFTADERCVITRKAIDKFLKLHANFSYPASLFFYLVDNLQKRTDIYFTELPSLIKDEAIRVEIEGAYGGLTDKYSHLENAKMLFNTALYTALKGGFSNFYGMNKNKYYKRMKNADGFIYSVLCAVYDPVADNLEAKARELAPKLRPFLLPKSIITSSGVTLPNAPCPCGSGKKYKKCCGAPVTGGDDTDVEKPKDEADEKPEGEVDAKPEGEVDAKPEGEVDAKPEGKVDAKPEGETDAKPEGEADAKPEGEADAKPDTGE